MAKGQPGLGWMATMLCGDDGESSKILAEAVGKTIREVSIPGYRKMILFEFEDNSKMRLKDVAQSCCEERYMTTDDDLEAFKGAEFLGIEVKKVEETEVDWGIHEIVFLEVKTSEGVITFAAHDEHNGYYGGIYIGAQRA